MLDRSGKRSGQHVDANGIIFGLCIALAVAWFSNELLAGAMQPKP
jgi:hypothetical protein